MPAPSITYGNLFDAAGIQRRFSASSLKDWQKCPRYYYYTWIEGWRSTGEESVHLTFGSHYAAALQKFYILLTSGTSREQAIISVVRFLFERTWDVETGKGWDPESLGLPKSNLKNRYTLIRAFIWYADEWGDDIPVLVLQNGQPAVELKFEIDIDRGNSLVGTIDRICNVDGELLILDQKTTGITLSGYWFADFELDTQMSLYTFAGRVGFSSAISGVMVDAMQVAVGFSRFARSITYRNEAQLNEWLEEANLYIDQIQHANGDGTLSAYPRNFNSCSNYGGCVFSNVCQKSPQVRPNFLRAGFRKEST